jgi:predicted RND superfamily exporter protein
VVTVVLAVAARSIAIAVLVIPVNALPLLGDVAAVQLLDLRLDPIALTVLTVGLGLAVDDTIHLLTHARERGGPAAIAQAVGSVGRAAVTTSLVLVGGFSVNLLSSFPPLRTLAALGGITIVIALVADLVLLPALVATRARR